MGVSLTKGQRVSLSKDNAGLSRVLVGLGWDKAPSWVSQTIDCDAIAFLLDGSNSIASREDVVYFNNLTHNTGCVIHMGDNLTGEGEGDDEQIVIDLAHLPARYERIVILASIYQATTKNQQFGMIENAFIRVADADTGKEFCRFNLTDNYDGKTALVAGELYRRNGEWKFNAVGQPLQIWTVAQLAERYGLPRSVWKKENENRH